MTTNFILNFLPNYYVPSLRENMRREIPSAVIAVIADLVSGNETHATLDSLFMYAGAPGDPPEGSKHTKALKWQRIINRDESVSDPLAVLGKLIEGYMEAVADSSTFNDNFIPERMNRIEKVLSSTGLEYLRGGIVVAKGVATPSRTLEYHIRKLNYLSVNEEFDRALRTVKSSPREAVSAACNILESVCKIYIEDEFLEMPTKKDLKSVWAVVRKSLGIDPSQTEDRDIQEILSGMLAVISGIGALRTHASSAHGAGKRIYQLEPRHAHLAVHSAHTLALFILESWAKQKRC